MMYSPQGPYSAQEPSGAVPYPPQDPYPAQQSFGAVPYSPQDPYPAQQSFGAVPYSPQDPYPAQQSFGAMPYSPQASYPPQQPFGMVPYFPQGPYIPQEPFMTPQPYEVPRNLQAKRAIINGFISLVLSAFTLVTPAGFAGLITATLAIIYGFWGLRAAKQLPNTMGRWQAIIGIVLGFMAWFVVILSAYLASRQ